MRRRIGIAAALLAGLLLGIVGVGVFLESQRDFNRASQVSVGSPVDIDAATRLTMKDYEALKSGMTYSDAVKVLGSTGKEMSSSEYAGQKSKIVVWENGDLSNISVTFIDDKIVGKAQLGIE